MKHNTFTKALAVFLSVLMTVTGCAVYASAACSHESYTWKTVTEPDCKAMTDGLEQKTCDDCGDVLEENVLEWEYAHDYSAQKWNKYPTCTEKGEYYEKCIYCDKLTSYVVLIPNTHEGFRNEYEYGKMKVWSYSDVANWFTDTPATCTQPGLRHAICKECGVEVASESIEPLGHKSEMYDDWLDSTNDAEDYIGSKNVAYVAPTCTEPGKGTFTCAACGETIATYEIAALGHTNAALDAWDYCFATDPDFGTDEDLIQYTSWNNVDYTPATCTDAGELGTYCATCNTLMKTEAIAATGHDYGEWTLNGDGTHSRACSRCAFTDKAKCKYDVTVTLPTCTEGGFTTFTCKDCGYTYDDLFTDPTGHDWTAWKEDKDAGTHSRVCNVCGEKETEAHCFGDFTYDRNAGFFKNGTKTCTCEVCGSTVTEKAKFTAWIWHVFYPVILWVGTIVHKSLFLGSLSWFLPWLNIQPQM